MPVEITTLSLKYFFLGKGLLGCSWGKWVGKGGGSLWGFFTASTTSIHVPLGPGIAPFMYNIWSSVFICPGWLI
jgi:hypothetical protein